MDAEYLQTNLLVQDLIRRVSFHRDGLLWESELASMVGYSIIHIRSVFYAAMGETLGEFIRRERLEWAAGMLSMGDMPVTDIAIAANYGSGEAFSRAFHTQFEVSPTKFRALNQGEEHLMPSYIYETDPARACAPMVVGHFIDIDLIVTRCYDRMALVGRILPDSPDDISVWSPAEERRVPAQGSLLPYGGYESCFQEALSVTTG